MKVSPEKWETVKSLFEAALERPTPERSLFLERECSDVSIRCEVQRLLASFGEAGDFLSSPAMGAGITTSVPERDPLFSPADVLDGRFRISRFLSRGGMGEVYEAEDLELGGRVALKTIRPELLADARSVERFKREVNLAKKVTHSNVCRIFDLSRHRPTGTLRAEHAGVFFVTMELLEGETLGECLRRDGRMKSEHALAIALQMAAGLGAAHEAGVLHRDFKPSNVILVREAKGARAVITDFGLAVASQRGSSADNTLTLAGTTLGTPAYMSPEQIESAEVTPSSDVYSLGLVLYELVTGTRPFEHPSPLSMAVRRLREDPANPVALVPDLDVRWQRVIAKCLKRNPRDRFQNGNEVLAALTPASGVHPKRSRVWAGGIAFAFLAAIIAFSLARLRGPSPDESDRALAAALPRNTQARRLYSQGVEKLRVFDALGARSLLSSAENIEPRSGVIHASLAEAWRALGYDGQAKAEANIAYHLASTLPREQQLLLEARSLSASNDWDRASQIYRSLCDFFPENLDYGVSLSHALVMAGKGNEALAELSAIRRLRGAADDARIPIEEAGADDLLGNFDKEEQAADAAIKRARGERMLAFLARALDAKTRSLGYRGEWQQTGRIASEAQNIYYRIGDRGGAARSLRALGVMSYKRGDYGNARRDYEQALETDREIGYDGEAAVALNDLATLTWDVGDWPGSEKYYEEAIRLFRKTGNKLGYATTLNNYAGILQVRGDLDGASRMYSEYLRVSRETGDRSGEGVAIENLAEVAAAQGKLNDALPLHRQALAIFQAIDDRSGAAYPLMGIGSVLEEQNKPDAAYSNYTQALNLRKQVGEETNAARTRLALSELMLNRRVAPTQVEPSLRQILDFVNHKGDVEAQIDAHMLLARVLLLEEKAGDAAAEIASARDGLKRSQDIDRLLRLEILSGKVEIATGEFEAAIARLQGAADRAERTGEVRDELEAEMALGTAEMRERKTSQAHAIWTAALTKARADGFTRLAAEMQRLR